MIHGHYQPGFSPLNRSHGRFPKVLGIIISDVLLKVKGISKTSRKNRKRRYNTSMKPEEKIIQKLIQKQKTLTIAESCTGGLLAARLTDVPGASDVFKLGVITYSNDAKIHILNVPAKVIQKKGAVSDEVATIMARNARQIHNTDFGIGITGIAGPGGGTKSKPVGLVFVAVATDWETLCIKCQFEGTRAQIRLQAVKQAIKLLLEFLE